MRPLDKVGHIGNLLPLFCIVLQREFAKFCPKSGLTMRRYINAAGNIPTSKADGLTAHVMYDPQSWTFDRGQTYTLYRLIRV